MLLLLLACAGEPDPTAWCEDPVPEPATTALTWAQDIEPIVTQKCARCHEEAGHPPFALETYADVAAHLPEVRAAVLAREMPPWLPAHCCQAYVDDFSLTDRELGDLVGWIDAGAPEGDTSDPADPLPPVGVLSRTDLTLAPEEAYTPAPEGGVGDDQRCFVLEWPYDEDKFITGMMPEPGARGIIHHVAVGSVAADGAQAVRDLDAAEAGPGFDCSGGFGDIASVTPIGGSVYGGDYPRGLGTQVTGGAVLILQVHYSLDEASDAEADLTRLALRIDDEATPSTGLVIANPAWLVGDAMAIPAGEPDATFWFQYRPSLLTGGVAVDVQGVTPHMHRYGTQLRMLVVHPDQTTDCLLSINDWAFGYEQGYWLQTPYRMAADDELYLECHFDNSAANQPDGGTPRDIAWGDSDQDMCAGFASVTAADP